MSGDAEECKPSFQLPEMNEKPMEPEWRRTSS